MTDSLRLDFSSGRTYLTGLAPINQELMKIGVRVSIVPLVKESLEILKLSTSPSSELLSLQQQQQLISMYALDRPALLGLIAEAGRDPACESGGSLVTSEKDVPPYPKVYDLKALGAQGQVDTQLKFGPFHVNSSADGVGVDEVMTLVSGGPWTWFFANSQDGELMKLSLGFVQPSKGAMRLSYCGINPHGAFMQSLSSPDGSNGGICVAHAHGPHEWRLEYADVGVNPWCDFSDSCCPVLL